MNKAPLPKNWEWRSIGSLCELVNGRAFKPSDWGKTGLPIIRIQNLNGLSKPFNYYSGKVDDKHVVNDGDILLSWSGTPGTSFGCFIWDRGKAVLNQHIFNVKVDPRACDPAYFTFAVNDILDEMIDQAHGGVGLRHITKGKLERIELPIAPLNEQRRIVGRIKECLSRVDEIKRLREEVQQEVTALQPASLNEIEKGLSCPKAKVGEIIENSQNGRSIRSDEINCNGHVLTLSAVRTLELDVEQRKLVQMTDSIAQKYEMKTNDVFISRANTIELVGLASILTTAPPERTIYPDLMIKLIPVLAKVQPKYLALALRFPSVRRQIQYHAKGSSQSMVKISGASLREVVIPLPSLDEQETIVAKADEARNVTALLKAEFDQKAVDGLTQAILRKAFAGEL